MTPDSAGRPPAGLKRLISPFPPEEFFRDYWGQRPLIVERDDQAYYENVLTLADIDHILATSSLRSTDLRLVQNGVETSMADLIADDAESKANGLEQLYQRYRDGATVNLIFLHERWQPLTRLCQRLAVELSASTHGNVYLTPPGTRGLTPHHDTHDVLVLQLYGTKHWQLYPTQTRIPLNSQHYRMPETGAGEVIQEFTLKPGDIAYLPRGTVHAATANDAASLHLTIGLSPVTYAEIVKRATDELVGADERFREALPPGFAIRSEIQEKAQLHLGALLENLHATLSTSKMLDQAARKALRRRMPALPGHLLDLEALPGVDLETSLHRQRDLVFRMLQDDERVHLEFHGKVIDFPEFVTDEVAYIAKADEFTGATIPGGLDEEGRLVLIQTLLREGFITVAR